MTNVDIVTGLLFAAVATIAGMHVWAHIVGRRALQPSPSHPAEPLELDLGLISGTVQPGDYQPLPASPTCWCCKSPTETTTSQQIELVETRGQWMAIRTCPTCTVAIADPVTLATAEALLAAGATLVMPTDAEIAHTFGLHR